MLSLQLRGLWGCKYLFEHMHWRVLKIMIHKLNTWLWDLSRKQSLETLMTAYLLKCEEESHTKEALGWKQYEKKQLCNGIDITEWARRWKKSVAVVLCGWILCMCFRRKNLFYISILKEKSEKNAAGAWGGGSGGGHGLAGGKKMRNLRTCGRDHVEETWG